MQNIYENVAKNKLRSNIVIFGFISFVTIASWVIGQASGYGMSYVGIALIISGLMSFFSYWNSDKMILAISHAKKATREEFFDYYTVMENISMASQIPMPKLYVIRDTAMNAFATGRDPEHAAVCATTGLLQRLNRSEIEAVMAHEISHIRNYDIRLMSLVTVLVGTLTLISDWFLRFSFRRRNNNDNEGGQIRLIIMVAGIILAIFSPIIANLIKLAISRRREFMADAGSAKITRQPSALISALIKISQDTEPLEAANKATAHLYISNPLKNRKKVSWLANMFNTHPPIEERIKALQSMS